MAYPVVICQAQTVLRSDMTLTMLPGPTSSMSYKSNRQHSFIHNTLLSRDTYLLMPAQQHTHRLCTTLLSLTKTSPTNLTEPRSLWRHTLWRPPSSSTRSILCHALVQVLHQCIQHFRAAFRLRDSLTYRRDFCLSDRLQNLCDCR